MPPQNELDRDARLQEKIFQGAATKHQGLEKDGIMRLARFDTRTVVVLKDLAKIFGINMDQ